MATTYLTRTTTAGTPTSSKKHTLSVWLKRSGLGAATFFNGGTNDQNQNFINFNPNDKIFIQNSTSNSNNLIFTTTQVFKDTSAWYNIIVAIDTTQATNTNRVKLYVNGVQVTAFDTATYPALDAEIEWNKSGATIEIGKYPFDSTGYAVYNGSMSHFNFIDGTQELPTAFGETDSTTGEWKIKTSPSVTYGNNGFFILKDGNSVTDQSGEGNNFAVTAGTLTNTEDCPSNNYPSVNINAGKAVDYLNATGLRYGNTQINQAGSPGVFISTLANTTGKYYWEMLIDAVGYTTQGVIAYDALVQTGGVNYLYTPAKGYGYVYTGNKGNNNSQVSYGASYTSGDYISVAFDQTNGSIWFAKNGAWQNSATTAEIGAGTTTNSAYSSMPTNGEFYAAAFGLDNSAVTSINYGNGTFGTTTLSTTYSPTVGDTGAKFKYNIIPTGFTAISTKGLNL
jgi:hypothetical protein